MKKISIYLVCFLFLDISQSIAMMSDKEGTADKNKNTSLIPLEDKTNNEATAIFDKIDKDNSEPTTELDGNKPLSLAETEEDRKEHLSSDMMTNNEEKNLYTEQKQEETKELKGISCLFYANIPPTPTPIRRILACLQLTSCRSDSTTQTSEKKYKVLFFREYAESDSAEGIHLITPESRLAMDQVNLWPTLDEYSKFKKLLKEIKQIQSETGNELCINLVDIRSILSKQQNNREEILSWFTSDEDISQSRNKSKSKHKGPLTARELREFKSNGLDIELSEAENTNQFNIFKNYVREKTKINTQYSETQLTTDGMKDPTDTGNESSKTEDIKDTETKTLEQSIATSQTGDIVKEPVPPSTEENLAKSLSDLDNIAQNMRDSSDKLASQLCTEDSGQVAIEQQRSND